MRFQKADREFGIFLLSISIAYKTCVVFQVVAGMNNDRLTLTVAEEIERLCGGWRPPPLRECVPIGLHRPSNM